MKRIKTVLLLLSIGIISSSIFGATMANWAVNDEADSFGVRVHVDSPESFTKVYYQSSFFYGGEGKVYAYAWDSKDESNKNAPWPGVEMNTEDYIHALYSYDVSNKFDKIIFHANVENDPTKTDDLTINTEKVYYSQHLNSWKSELSECSFAYYLTGKLNGIEAWGSKQYKYALFKNFSGGNINEYMSIDYVLQPGDSFKVIDENNTYYGVNGSSAGGSPNYDVRMKNTNNLSCQVYFIPNVNLYCGVNLYFKNVDPAGRGNKWWCYSYISTGGETKAWPGEVMSAEAEYWYRSNVPVNCDMVIFNNYNEKGKYQTNNLEVDISFPFFNGTKWCASKLG